MNNIIKLSPFAKFHVILQADNCVYFASHTNLFFLFYSVTVFLLKRSFVFLLLRYY